MVSVLGSYCDSWKRFRQALFRDFGRNEAIDPGGSRRGFGRDNGPMDVAVNLVESYLRLNGYFTLSELEIQGQMPDGSFETLTDVDIVAIRFPGPGQRAGARRDDDDCHMLLIDDPELRLEPDTVDLVIGEVKEGHPVFNPGLKRHEVLHAVLGRVDWLFDEPSLHVVERLQRDDVAMVSLRSGGEMRARLVAFGRSTVSNLHTMSLSHVVETMVGFMEEFDDVLRSARFKDPAPALLRLLTKAGFAVEKEPYDVAES